jgi:Holliday junction resolvasome RuvABC endonuclease subunit
MGRVKAEESGRLVVLGVDPGFAKIGFAVVSSSGRGDYRLEHGGVITTVKMSKKKRCGLRVTNEDVLRHRKIWEGLEEVRREYGAYAVGTEAYVVDGRGGRGKNSAAKTLGVYGGILWWSFCRGFHAAPFIPQDLKRRFCGSQKGSKEDVIKSIKKQVRCFEQGLERICESDQEHFSDAVGVAVLMLEDVFEMRKQLGVR